MYALSGQHRAPPLSQCTGWATVPGPGQDLLLRRGQETIRLVNGRALSGLGTVDPWSCMSCHLWSADDVYVLRFTMLGATIRDARDALRLVQAAGQDQNLRLDVRGIAVKDDVLAQGGVPCQVVDVIYTVREGGLGIPFLADNAADITKAMGADPDLLGAFPKLTIPPQLALFGRLTGPSAALDHWRAQAVLWSASLSGPRGRGGPSDAFAMPAPLALVRGSADDGKLAKPLAAMTAPPPIGGPGKSPGAELDWTVLGLGVAVLAVSGLALYHSRSRSPVGREARGAAR